MDGWERLTKKYGNCPSGRQKRKQISPEMGHCKLSYKQVYRVLYVRQPTVAVSPTQFVPSPVNKASKTNQGGLPWLGLGCFSLRSPHPVHHGKLYEIAMEIEAPVLPVKQFIATTLTCIRGFPAQYFVSLHFDYILVLYFVELHACDLHKPCCLTTAEP